MKFCGFEATLFAYLEVRKKNNQILAGLLMGDDIGPGLSSRSVCFDFRTTNAGSSAHRTRASTGFDDITH